MTQTQALLPGSPAINAGDNCVLTNTCASDNLGFNLTTDQRGAGFPRQSSNAVDIGAFEFPFITVTSLGDGAATAANCPGVNCRLRDAIAKAVAGDTIDFAVTGTITLTSGHLVINKNLTIQGPGAAQLTISGNQASRVFFINPASVSATLSGVTITNGSAPGAGGAGIYNDGSLTLTNCVLSGNSASSGAGLSNSSSGSATITNCTFSGNSATGVGGIIANAGTMTLSNSTISGNMSLEGGGIFTISATMTLSNSTISGNSATNGGGISIAGGTLTISNSTISGNSATNLGGGILRTGSTIINARNTLIAGNTAPTGPDVRGALTSLGHNLIGNNSGATITLTTGDLIGTAAAPINPLLAPLANYGGPTQTHALLPGSPALNAGNNCVLTNTCASNNLGFNLTTDQRGAGFNRQSGNAVDIGAFEFPFITVTSLGDGAATAANCPGVNCRLRDAIAKAVAGDTIDFAVTGTITLTSGHLVINKNLTIQGPGAAQLTISGNQASRVFFINPASVSATLSGVTIANGNVTGSLGAGIYNDGSLTLTNCVLSGNSAVSVSGGGLFNSSSGSATITDCTFSGNSAAHSGGAFVNSGSLTLSNSTITGNSVSFTGAAGGGINQTSGTLTISNSTLSGNSASGFGGGILITSGTLTISNSTLSGNSASGFGGGIYPNGGTLNARNTLIAGNAAPTSPDVAGALTSLGHNLIGNNSGATITPTTGDLIGTAAAPINPLLAPLANYGGPTQTHALLPGSPAINAGNNCVLTNTCASNNLGFNLTTDQRGAGFNRQVGNAVDIGAFESRGFTLALASGNNQAAPTTMAFASPLSVTVSSAFSEPVNGGRVTFTPPGSGASATVAGNPATLASGTATSGIVTANTLVGGPYNVVASANGATPSINFALTNTNNAPTITAGAALTRPRGSAGTSNTIATVSDLETPAGNLVVTATTVPVGITVTSISNTASTITATVAAACNAPFGANNVVLTVTDGNGGTAMATLTVTVSDNTAPTLTYPAASVAAGAATTVTPMTATDNGSITGYSIVSVVPPLTTAPTVNASGVVSITNASPAGNHVITVQATDNCGATTNAMFTLTVTCPTITVMVPATNTGTVGAAFSQTFTQTGGLGATTFSVSAGTLPSGLTLAANGTLSGTPTQAGTFPLTVKATDSNGCMGTQSYTLTLTCQTITVSPANPTLPIGRAGTAYTQTFTQTGGNGASTFSLSAGALPTGLTLNSSSGLLDGTPTVSGTFNFTVRATDANGCTGERAYTLLLNPACTPISVSPATLPNGFQGTAYSQTLTATGGGAPYTFAVTGGTLPGGLNLATGGALTGTPTAAGTFSFTVTATDNTGCTGTRSYSVIISGNGLQFYPLAAPVRLLDTRAGQVACTQPNAPIAGQTSLTQAGRSTCGIPANAVALTGNLTTVQSGGGFLTLYPSNAVQPTVASVNYAPNEIINNVFTVGLGTDGAFKIFAFNTTDVVVDVTGYYAPPVANGLYFHPLPKPIRLLETRAGQLGCTTPGAPLQGGEAGTLTQQARISCDGVTIPSGALAIVGNATTVNPQGVGFLTLFPGNATRPLAAASNYGTGQIVNGTFSVGLAPNGEFKIYTFATTDLVVDVLG